MADNIDVNVNVNTSQANRNLDNLNNRVAGLNKSFSGLKAAIGGIAFGALINNSLRFAASMVDVSTSTDIALESVVGFSRAVQDNGGSIESAQNALQKFNITIADAAEGSAAAQDAFRQVGVSINDLRTLSQEDLLRKTIQGLNQIGDASLRAKLQTELLGKAFRGVDIKGLAAEYDDAIRSSGRYVASIRTADETQRKLENSLTDLRVVLLDVIEPLASIANKIDVTSESFARFVKGVQYAAAALAAIFVGGRILGGILAIYRAVKALDVGLRGIATIPIKDIFKGLFSSKAAKDTLQKLEDLRNDIVKRFNRNPPGMPPAADAVQKANEKYQKFKDLLDGAYESARKLLGVLVSVVGIGGAFTLGAAQKPKFDARDKGARQAGAADAAIRFPGAAEEAMAKREVIVATEKLTTAIANNAQAYIAQKEAQLAALKAGASYALMSDETKAILDAQRTIYDDFNNKIEEYEDKISELLPDQDDLRKAYLAQIEVLKKTRDAQMIQATDAVIATNEQINAQKNLQAELQRTFDQYRAENALADLEAELDLMGLQGDELERQQRLLATQQEMRDKVMSAMQGLIDLENRRGQLSDEQYQRDRDNLLKELDLARQIAEGKLAIDEKYFRRKQELENDYNAGVEKALKDIAEQFKPINMAQEAVQKAWGKISDAIDTFVETGKFNFKDFAASVLQDLAKMIAKAMIFKYIFEPIMGALGLPMPGMKAKGGPVQGKTPYIVGEKGPELFVPNASGNIIPNNKLNQGMATGAVNAPVTNNYNTYNINALDSKSVAQVFAENRKSLLGAVGMAQKEMPYMMG